MNELQIQASNPAYSSWVSASAGTGKTKLLIDRVLRLLLQGNNFAKIICLTFTNAAAGEMKERVSKILATWSELDQEQLKQELFFVLGRKVTKIELSLATKLYEQYLQLEEKINIQTIHAFCQKLLKKFPLECGLSPSFSIIDEVESFLLLKKIRNQLLNDLHMQKINQYLSENFHEVIINKIINEIIINKIKFTEINHDNFTITEDIEQELEHQEKDFWQNVSTNPLIKEFFGSNKNQTELRAIFLTKTGQKRQKVISTKIAKLGSNTYLALEKIQIELLQLEQQRNSWELIKHSSLILTLAKEILAQYEQYKQSKALLDYDDLIIKAHNLLNNNVAKEWILYKLDGGIEHLLIDEAQDTSHYQWEIINNLITEFYVGDSLEEKARSIFVVGDAKQSIFSFQGADIAAFHKFNQLLARKMQQGNKKFKNIELDISYRSAPSILKIVNLVFSDIYQKTPELFATNIKELKPNRNDHQGSVELWPLVELAPEETEFWPVITSVDEKITPQEKLAQNIANFIAEKLETKMVLASTRQQIKAADFMILFRRRDSLTDSVINALKEKNIPVSGLDRIKLTNNIAVMDLLSIAKFVLAREDDLNICTLLKSAIFDLPEIIIYQLCQKKNEQLTSIWQIICREAEYDQLYQELNKFNQLFQISHIGNFFHIIVDIFNYRTKLKRACGADSDDAINELLQLATKFQRNHSLSLQNFLFWFNEYSTSLKRDVEATGKVRIMTMHAAKGLQAPIVILGDTTSIPTQSNLFQWSENGMFFTAKNANHTPDYFNEIKEQKQQATYAEYLRLLYVGMTRAEDHLIICGYQTKKTIPENCWYSLIKNSLSKQEDGKNIEMENLMIGSYPQNIDPLKIPLQKDQLLELTIFDSDATNELPKTEIIARGDNSYNSLAELTPINYGLMFHKILEDVILTKDINNLSKHPLLTDLNQKMQRRILASIEKIKRNQEFGDFLNEEFYTELSVGLNQDDNISIGRIDLMIKREKEIIIIDYKSDLKPVLNPTAISTNYRQQLEFYADMLNKIYPDKVITKMIFWLEIGQLMRL